MDDTLGLLYSPPLDPPPLPPLCVICVEEHLDMVGLAGYVGELPPATSLGQQGAPIAVSDGHIIKPTSPLILNFKSGEMEANAFAGRNRNFLCPVQGIWIF